jgi:hypothetical protein
MTVFRSPMEKILDQQEDETVITNPKDRFRTFLRKIAYRFAVWKDRLRRLFTREQDE